MSESNLPCPFCASSPEVYDVTDQPAEFERHANCPNGCAGPMSLTRWNARPSMLARDRNRPLLRADVRAAVCDHLETWARVLVENNHPSAEAVRRVFQMIRKSSLLGRLVYGGEKLRTQRCPKHLGKWSGLPGLEPDDCACDMTGWLPAEKGERATTTREGGDGG